MDATALLIVVLVLPLLIVAVMRSNKNQQIEQARVRYQEALGKLKSDPANSDLRQAALDLGRQFSNMARDKRGVTLFDEVALMNDINAATAGVGAARPAAAAPNVTAASVEDRLAKLADLKAKGMIDEQEYAAKRQQILGEM